MCAGPAGICDDDRQRLQAISQILDQEVGSAARFTLDGNENYQSIDHFRDDFESYLSRPELKSFFQRGLLFVEQPLHRDHALQDSVRESLSSWTSAPSLIIDESDADLASLPRALELGYAGTSHKNCKGVIKGLLNAATLIQSQSHPEHRRSAVILSAEDLSNTGPVALLQDLAVAASLGIQHIERNGQHYFAGLSQFPRSVQEQALYDHSDLFHRTSHGLIAVHPQQGRLHIQSVLAAPFGMVEHPDVTQFEPW